MRMWRVFVAGWLGLGFRWRKGIGLACVVGSICAPVRVSAQTPIVIGPASTVQWDLAVTPAAAQACSYSLIVDAGNPLPLGNVTCGTGPTPALPTTCKVLASSVVPIGSHSLTATTTCSGVTSLPSTPYAYLTVVVPVPQGLRIV